MSELVLDGVEHGYATPAGRLAVLRGVALRAVPGETIAIVGPSGSGKSTLLHIIGALHPPDAGTVRLGEIDVAALTGQALAAYRARQVGFVFQDHHLLPQLTAVENVLLPTLALPAPPAAAGARAQALLERVGLAGRVEAFPARMSGGERQRVALARALMNTPRLLLCDEPTGNLDGEAAEAVMTLLLALARDAGTTVLLVTHNLALAARCARTVALRGGQLLPYVHTA